jgi:hypothetical protein
MSIYVLLQDALLTDNHLSPQVSDFFGAIAPLPASYFTTYR